MACLSRHAAGPEWEQQQCSFAARFWQERVTLTPTMLQSRNWQKVFLFQTEMPGCEQGARVEANQNHSLELGREHTWPLSAPFTTVQWGMGWFWSSAKFSEEEYKQLVERREMSRNMFHDKMVETCKVCTFLEFPAPTLWTDISAVRV